MFKTIKIITPILAIPYIGYQIYKSNNPTHTPKQFLSNTTQIIVSTLSYKAPDFILQKTGQLIANSDLYYPGLFLYKSNIIICKEISKSNPKLLYQNFENLSIYIPRDYLCETNINNKLIRNQIANDIINNKISLYEFRKFDICQKIVNKIIKLDPEFIINNKDMFYDMALPKFIFEKIIKDDKLIKLIVTKQFESDKTVRHYGYQYKFNGINTVDKFNSKTCAWGGLHFTSESNYKSHDYICRNSANCGIFKVKLVDGKLYSYDIFMDKYKGSGIRIGEKLGEIRN
jgi:hypothetical protein